MIKPPPQLPFWKTTSLEDMSEAQWESLCDGCGRCCLVKLEDEDSGNILFTDVRCTLLDGGTCRCKDYKNRRSQVEDCVQLTPKLVRTLTWLPRTCAYRLIAEGRDLEPWHPLVSGSPDSVHEAGISVRNKTAGSEDDMTVEQQMNRVVTWPNEWPRRKKHRRARR